MSVTNGSSGFERPTKAPKTKMLSMDRSTRFVTTILVPSLIATARNVATAITHDTRASVEPWLFELLPDMLREAGIQDFALEENAKKMLKTKRTAS